MKKISECKKDFVEIDCGRGIKVFLFNKCYDLAMSFVRVQEFQESPKFSGQKFDLEDFIDWYSLEYGKGAFTYANDWNGFNVSGHTLNAWLNSIGWGHSDAYRRCPQFVLRSREMTCFGKYIQHVKDKEKKLYFIGLHREGIDLISVLKHELCHALYSVSTEYRVACQSIIRDMSVRTVKSIYKWLEKKGYNKVVFEDELQAYMISGIEIMKLKIPKKDLEKFKKLSTEWVEDMLDNAWGGLHDKKHT